MLIASGRTILADQVFDVGVPRKAHETFDDAAFRLWLPEHAGPLQGIAVVLDGINVDGRHLAARAEWQNFARAHSLALVACYFRTDDPSDLSQAYSEAKRGSGRALLDGLAALGKTSGHPEMETAPIYILGFSAGGQFSYSFACFCPARVAAFVANKGGIYATKATPAVREIPGLFIAGQKDLGTRRSAIRNIFMENRKLGARWCLANEPGRGHETAHANEIALPFFEAVMRARERPASERAGVVLDLDHKQLIAPGVPPANTGLTFWFPDESVIATWNTFVTKAH